MIKIIVVLLICSPSEPDACYEHKIYHQVQARELTPWKCQHYGMLDAIAYLKSKGHPKGLRVAKVTCGKYREEA